MSGQKEKSNQHLFQQGQGLDGLYRGVVRKQMDGGKCKVWVPGVYDPQFEADGNEDFLPNAEIMMPVFAKSIDQSGWFCCPDVGALVFVRFLNGDANYPIVVGCTMNNVPGYGKSQFNKCMRQKKYVKHIMKNGVAEIALDENGSIELTVQSQEGAAQDNGSMKEARVLIDRTNCNNRIILSADDIVLDCNNLLLKGFNIDIDGGSKVQIHGRGGLVSMDSPSVFISANNGQGTNAVVIKGASGTTVL